MSTTEHSIINKDARDKEFRTRAEYAIDDIVFLAEVDDWHIYLDPGSPGLRYLIMSSDCKHPCTMWVTGRPGEYKWKTTPPSVDAFLLAHLELFPPPPPVDYP